jgi:hypothetical protein
VQTDLDPKRISQELRRQDLEIQLIRAKQSAGDWVMILTAVTRSLTTLGVIISGAFLLANRIEIPGPAWGIATLVIVGTFGLEALAKRLLNGKIQ